MYLLKYSKKSYIPEEAERKGNRKQLLRNGRYGEQGLDRSNQSQRYAIIGLTVHGFYHKMCINTKFHQPSEQCVCKICEQACERYHFHKCKKRTGTLNDFIKST